MSTSNKSNKSNEFSKSGRTVAVQEPAASGHDVYATAYALVRDEAAAVPKERVHSYGIKTTYASGVARTAAERCEELAPELAELPRFALARVQSIPAYARALQYTQGQLSTSGATTDGLATQNERATALIERFESASNTLVLFGLLDAKTVAPLRVTLKRGYQVSVDTLIAYANVYEALLAKAGVPTPITLAHVAEARALADEMTGGIGSRTSSSGSREYWIEQRWRVSALLVSAYAELRAGVAFVRRNEGDASEFTPPLHVQGSRGGDTSGEQDGDDGDGEGDGEGAVVKEVVEKAKAEKTSEKKGDVEKVDDDAPHGPPGSITNPFLP